MLCLLFLRLTGYSWVGSHLLSCILSPLNVLLLNFNSWKGTWQIDTWYLHKALSHFSFIVKHPWEAKSWLAGQNCTPVEHEGSLLCSQKPTTGPYIEPGESSQYVHTLFLTYVLLILLCISRFLQVFIYFLWAHSIAWGCVWNSEPWTKQVIELYTY